MNAARGDNDSKVCERGSAHGVGVAERDSICTRILTGESDGPMGQRRCEECGPDRLTRDAPRREGLARRSTAGNVAGWVFDICCLRWRAWVGHSLTDKVNGYSYGTS